MTESPHVSLLARLEGLPGRFASNLLRVEAHQLDGAITGMLEMTGDTLDADWATLEEYPNCEGKSGAARAWRRPGAGVPGEPAVVLPVHAGSRHICTLSFGRCGDDPCWAVDVVERLRPVADLVAMAIERQAQAVDEPDATAAQWKALDDTLRAFVGESDKLWRLNDVHGNGIAHQRNRHRSVRRGSNSAQRAGGGVKRSCERQHFDRLARHSHHRGVLWR